MMKIMMIMVMIMVMMMMEYTREKTSCSSVVLLVSCTITTRMGD